MIIDRYLLVVSALAEAIVWIVADAMGFTLSDGTKTAMGTFLLYAGYKSRTDSRWRELEEAEAERAALVDATPSVAPAPLPAKGKAKEGAK